MTEKTKTKVQEIGALVHERWKASGIPQVEVLRRMGITRSHFNKVVHGKYPADTEFLADFADAIGAQLAVVFRAKM